MNIKQLFPLASRLEEKSGYIVYETGTCPAYVYYHPETGYLNVFNKKEHLIFLSQVDSIITGINENNWYARGVHHLCLILIKEKRSVNEYFKLLTRICK